MLEMHLKLRCQQPKKFLCIFELSSSVVSNSLHPMDCSPPDTSVHGDSPWTRILEWVIISFSMCIQRDGYIKTSWEKQTKKQQIQTQKRESNPNTTLKTAIKSQAKTTKEEQKRSTKTNPKLLTRWQYILIISLNVKWNKCFNQKIQTG